jgi:hypothetical protein
MTLRNVYGGNLIVGATSNLYSYNSSLTPPFRGGSVKVAGRAPGSTTPVSVANAAQEVTVSVSDPAGFAFGPLCCGGVSQMFSVTTSFGTQPLSQTVFDPPNFYFFALARVSVPAIYSAASNKIVVETFTPFALRVGYLKVCGGISCHQLNGTGTFIVQRPFADAGTNLTYFKWKASGAASSVTQSVSGYTINVHSAGTGTLASTTPTILLPRQKIQIANALPLGTLWTVTAKDAHGIVYTNSGANSSIGYATVEMDSVAGTTPITSISLSFHSAGAGTFGLISITNQ